MAFKALTKEWRLQEADPDYSLEDPIDSDTRSLFSRNGGITRRSIIDGFGSVKKELSILSPLKHPHIIQLHGVMMRPLGLILELAPLGSLKNILHEYAEAHAHLHISVTKQVVIQVCFVTFMYLGVGQSTKLVGIEKLLHNIPDANVRGSYIWLPLKPT